MIKEEVMKETRSILKCLLQHGRAPEYMYSRCYNNNKRRRTSNINSTEGNRLETVRFGRVPKNEKERIRQAMEKANNNGSQTPEVSDDYLVQSITNSHLRSCVVSNESVKHIISIAESSTHSPPLGFNPVSNCPLNPYVAGEDFHQKFSPIVREVVGFAKNIPGFTEVRHDDKITLLRACVFEVLLIRFATLVDAKNRRIITITGFIIGASIYASHKPSNDFVNTLFTFVERISSLSLVDEEMALFTAAIVINPKREGLLDMPKISCIHKRIVNCLQLVMQRERPNDPNACQGLLSTLNDLWILNGMHSKQTQAKHKGDEMVSMNGHQTESLNGQYQSSYSVFPESQTCPIRYASSSSSSPEYDDKRMTIDESSPTSPTSTFSPDEEMRSPGSADSGCSTDSGCSIESGCSSDSGCSLTSHTTEHRAPALLSEEHREVLSSPYDESTDGVRKCHIKRKAIMRSEETRMDTEKSRSVQWHKPQKDTEKSADSPVLRMCLEAPSTLKMETFTDYYRGHVTSHHHKKFRSTLVLQEKAAQSHETLDSTSSSLPSCTPSPSYSLSPSPSSSLGSSPARISSFSPCSSSSSSNTHSLASTSILAHRLALPIGSFPQTSRLIQSLTQETSIGKNKVQMVCDALHDSIMSDESKVRCPHVLAAPSPSRYDDLRNSSPMHISHMSPHHSITTSPPPHHISSLHNSPHHNSPPHSYSSPPLSSSHHIPPAHSPQSYGSGMSDLEVQPLNLSTKTPSPPPFMEG